MSANVRVNIKQTPFPSRICDPQHLSPFTDLPLLPNIRVFHFHAGRFVQNSSVLLFAMGRVWNGRRLDTKLAANVDYPTNKAIPSTPVAKKGDPYSMYLKWS